MKCITCKKEFRVDVVRMECPNCKQDKTKRLLEYQPSIEEIKKLKETNEVLKEKNEDLLNELHPDKGCYSCYHPYWKSDREYGFLYCPKRKLDEPQKKDITRDCWKKVEPAFKQYEGLIRRIKELEKVIPTGSGILGHPTYNFHAYYMEVIEEKDKEIKRLKSNK